MKVLVMSVPGAQLGQKGAALVLRTVRAIAADDYPQVAQPPMQEGKEAPKLFRGICEIDWQQPAAEIRNFVRGLSPYPAAWTTLNGLNCKLFAVSVVEKRLPNDSTEPGAYRTDQKTFLHFLAADAWVAVHELQLEGKRRMKIDELLRGFKV